MSSLSWLNIASKSQIIEKSLLGLYYIPPVGTMGNKKPQKTLPEVKIPKMT
jgi:hypothetical protein